VNQPIGAVGEDNQTAEVMLDTLPIFADAKCKTDRLSAQESFPRRFEPYPLLRAIVA
jgi:hypothetical protein